MRHVIRLNRPNQVSIDPDGGNLTVWQDDDEFVIEAASLKDLLFFVADVATAGAWREETVERRMEAEYVPLSQITSQVRQLKAGW